MEERKYNELSNYCDNPSCECDQVGPEMYAPPMEGGNKKGAVESLVEAEIFTPSKKGDDTCYKSSPKGCDLSCHGLCEICDCDCYSLPPGTF